MASTVSQGMVTVPLEQGDGGVCDVWEASALPIVLSSFRKGNSRRSQVQRVILQILTNFKHTHVQVPSILIVFKHTLKSYSMFNFCCVVNTLYHNSKLNILSFLQQLKM